MSEACNTHTSCDAAGAAAQDSCCPTTTANASPCGTDAEVCPVDVAIQMNKKAFFSALHQVQTEALAAKIRKEWGEHIDKETDAVMKAMATTWQSRIAAGKARKDLREEMAGILCSGGDS